MLYMDKTIITPIEWSAPEYTHKARTNDWYWSIGLVALVGMVGALWFHNYIFAIFILVSGVCLILFTLRLPQEVTFVVKETGIGIAREDHPWSEIKGFKIKTDTPYSKLLLLTSKKFLPIYTVPFPPEKSQEIEEFLLKFIQVIEELDESPSMVFMEKLGF